MLTSRPRILAFADRCLLLWQVRLPERGVNASHTGLFKRGYGILISSTPHDGVDGRTTRRENTNITVEIHNLRTTNKTIPNYGFEKWNSGQFAEGWFYFQLIYWMKAIPNSTDS